MKGATIMVIHAVIDNHDAAGGVVYGRIGDMSVGVGLNGYSMTAAMDARLAIEGYRRIGDWIQSGPWHYRAPIEVHPQRCETCVHGCGCEVGTPGCGHAHCWGSSDMSCPVALRA
jgi:hypothetical protein